ncbi:Qat anti-phage system associated protein QatB [Shewanella marisflavi]|uniref:Uncharacterized protein n=1 Tax=Shewanella marisflavi TaxID=260364 RepID=A0AAC9XMJ5_9GAMM|nr:Qat anti-phage system associated protein QatB [Shewanella marisflavi]ASJ95634.1 hypothetical protein CFF01_03000 [Shewanella marisflavi]
MGTSTTNSGPNSNNPLVPTWLEGQGGGTGDDKNDGQNNKPEQLKQPQIKPQQGRRFQSARSGINDYLRTGNTGSMKKGISRYVKSSGGKSSAVKRMGASPRAASNFVSFLSDVAQNGIQAVAKNLNLALQGNESADQLLLRVADQICEVSTSSIPDAVVRVSYAETVVEMTTTLGVTDLNAITSEQIKASLSCFIGKSVTNRIINDICNNLVAQKASPENLQAALSELSGYIEGRADDVIASFPTENLSLTDEELVGGIENLYSEVFEILASVEDE